MMSVLPAELHTPIRAPCFCFFRLAGTFILGAMLVLAGATYLARRQVVRIFTDEQGVIELTATVVPAVASSLIGETDEMVHVSVIDSLSASKGPTLSVWLALQSLSLTRAPSA